MLVEDDAFGAVTNSAGHHLPVLALAHVEQLVLSANFLGYLVLEYVPVVLEEVNVPYIATFESKVHWLVAVMVTHLFYDPQPLRLPPVP